MVDAAELTTNVLEFLRKSFAFERTERVDDAAWAVFARRETESESQFRPRLVRLFVAVPLDRVVFDAEADLLLLAPDGRTPGPRAGGTAQEAAAEATQFTEQGIAWRRLAVPDGFAYLPAERAGAATLRALGFGGAS